MMLRKVILALVWSGLIIGPVAFAQAVADIIGIQIIDSEEGSLVLDYAAVQNELKLSGGQIAKITGLSDKLKATAETRSS